MIQQNKNSVSCFVILLLSPNAAYASGDMEIAGLGTLLITTQLMVVIWLGLSKKSKNIKMPFFLILCVVYSLLWSLLGIMPSNWEHTKLIMGGLSTVPLIVGFIFNFINCSRPLL